MKWLNGYRIRLMLVGFVNVALLTQPAIGSDSEGVRPIADAGLPRYAAQDPVVLDGTGSYDPDNSGTLSYMWRQISGPSVIISNSDTAAPTISGFTQTDVIQECEFELIVSDGEMTSWLDTVKVIIVPTFTDSTLILENDVFDPQKATIIYFGGGSASDLGRGSGGWADSAWKKKANIISMSPYVADPGSIPGWNAGAKLTFSRCADIIIVYMSAVAPNYKGAIQTMGLSLGGVPAIDVALRLNKIYADARYAVNRVSFLDATKSVLGNSEYDARVADFLASPVGGEQCWLDCYDSAYGGDYPNALNVWFKTRVHEFARDWYRESLTHEDMNVFNDGIIAGTYWSVIGPGRNFQLALTPGVETYKFTWYGDAFSGYTDFFDESLYPGRLPEPVTLVGPVYTEDSNGIILTCQESKNAVGYQLLFGPDPYHVKDYSIISDTPAPPNDVITMLPFEETWWTIKVRDQYGSTIYADPIPLYSFASKPDPSDGTLLIVTSARLSWTVGIATASHNVYFSDNINDVSAGAEGTLLASVGRSAVGVVVDNLIAETHYYWRVDSVEADGTIHMGDVWSFTLAPQTASAPIPADGAVFIDPAVTLSWTQGLDAVSHIVYIGENFDEVNNATEGTLQEDATYTPEESFARGTVYYWRVDSVEADGTIHMGDVWSFETPPFIEITDPNLVAWWKLDGEYFDLGYIVDYSGYNHHGTPHGDVHPVEGYDGGAMEFDGYGDYIKIDGYKGINADANGVQPAFSVSAWFKTTGNGVIVSWGSPFSGQRFTFRLNDGRLRTEHGNGNLQGDTTCNDGEWHNFTLTVLYDAPCDDPDTVIYLDGVVDSRISTGTSNTYDLVARADVIIGRSATRGDRYFPGLIDDVRIYDVALSAEEIEALVQ